MFLPAEAVFSYIYASCDEVVRYSYEEKVYMVSVEHADGISDRNTCDLSGRTAQ